MMESSEWSLQIHLRIEMRTYTSSVRLPFGIIIEFGFECQFVEDSLIQPPAICNSFHSQEEWDSPSGDQLTPPELVPGCENNSTALEPGD